MKNLQTIMLIAISMMILLLFVMGLNNSIQNGRYQIDSYGMAIEGIFILDTKTGQLWNRTLNYCFYYGTPNHPTCTRIWKRPIKTNEEIFGVRKPNKVKSFEEIIPDSQKHRDILDDFAAKKQE